MCDQFELMPDFRMRHVVLIQEIPIRTNESAKNYSCNCILLNLVETIHEAQEMPIMQHG